MRVHGPLGPVSWESVAVLNLPRGGLRIGSVDARLYPEAIRLLQSRATSGVIYAGPDAPELYFLAQLKNPTPAIFDFLVPDTLFHPNLIQRLDSSGVTAVALRRHVVHSPPLEPEVAAAFVRQFPMALEIGRFTLRWK